MPIGCDSLFILKRSLIVFLVGDDSFNFLFHIYLHGVYKHST